MRVNLNLHFSRLLALIGIALATASVRASTNPADFEFAREPYLQFATTNSIVVVWRTTGPVDPVVRFGRAPDRLDRVSTNESIAIRTSLEKNAQVDFSKWEALRTEENLRRKLHSAPVGTFQYEAKLTGLDPATRYYYAVFDGERRLTPPDASYTFQTPPPTGDRRPMRFWVIGDGGTGRREQADVHQAMLDFVKKSGKPLDFWLHVGDMAYGIGRDMEFQSRFFKPYEASLRSSVCWPAMGNHEGHTSKGTTGIGPYYDAYVVPRRGEAGGLASGTEAYYSFDHGNVHFICLDSHDLDRKATGSMARWLKADLERANAEWVIAFWHHPPYTKGSHDSDTEKDLTEMREYIMPIIDAGGVDLVLTGHSHIYERSMLVDGAYATPTISENVILNDGDGDPNGDGPYHKSPGINPHEGTVQVVAGHAGQNLGRKAATSPIMRKTIAEFGSVIVDVNGDTLTGIMVNRNGATRDLFSMVKREKVTPVRLALPWQPENRKTDSTPKVANAPAVNHKVLIPKNAEWTYLTGKHPEGRAWTSKNFDTSSWKKGAAGFGHGDVEYQTVAPGAAGHTASIYLRKEFNLKQGDRVTELGLMIDYADGFIAYLNGVEVARVGIGRSSGRNAQKITQRAPRGWTYVSLNDAYKHTRDGVNILAIECHATEESEDFSIHPTLLLED